MLRQADPPAFAARGQEGKDGKGPAGPLQEEEEPDSDDPDAVEQLGFWRRWATKISTNPDFEMLVILLIVGNCVSLALYQPLLGDDAQFNKDLGIVELAFNVMFSVEMVLRWGAEGVG